MADLLKYLESSGLSRHMSTLMEVLMTESPCSFFFSLFPILLISIVDRLSYDKQDQLDSGWLHRSSHIMGHLLSTCCRLSSRVVDVSSPVDSQGIPIDTLESEWKIANEYYFKSIASMQLLQHIRWNFHKDFTLDQVGKDRKWKTTPHLCRAPPSLEQLQNSPVKTCCDQFCDHLMKFPLLIFTSIILSYIPYKKDKR